MLNDQKCHFLQLKLELYSLYWALHTHKVFIIGIQNLVIKVDYYLIKGMLEHPDLTPSASMNYWIISIQMFHFELIYVLDT